MNLTICKLSFYFILITNCFLFSQVQFMAMSITFLLVAERRQFVCTTMQWTIRIWFAIYIYIVILYSNFFSLQKNRLRIHGSQWSPRDYTIDRSNLSDNHTSLRILSAFFLF